MPFICEETTKIAHEELVVNILVGQSVVRKQISKPPSLKGKRVVVIEGTSGI